MCVLGVAQDSPERSNRSEVILLEKFPGHVRKIMAAVVHFIGEILGRLMNLFACLSGADFLSSNFHNFHNLNGGLQNVPTSPLIIGATEKMTNKGIPTES